MKDFALQLEGCSKADRKKVIKAAKSVGMTWYDNDRFNSSEWAYLLVGDKSSELLYTHSNSDVYSIYKMPQDWELIKEDLGVEVEQKHPEYVELTVCRGKSKWSNGRCGEIFKIHDISFLGEWCYIIDTLTNGRGGIRLNDCKPSTKEAYENQEAKKNVSFSADDVLKVSDAFRIESSKLRGRLSKKSDRIKDLEKENELFRCRIKELTDQCDEIYANNKPNVIINELNVEIETKDKRIAELEGNLILVGDLISKTLS